MNYINAKDYLNSYKNLNNQINILKDEILETKEIIMSISGHSFDEVRVQSTKNKDQLPNAIIMLMDKIDFYEKQLARKEALKHKILKQIHLLDNKYEGKVLECVYIYNLTGDETAELLFFSPRWVRELKRRGLKNFDDILLRSMKNVEN